MKESRFNRRHFLTSAAVVCLGQKMPDPVLYFVTSIDKLKVQTRKNLLVYLDAINEKVHLEELACRLVFAPVLVPIMA